jgi:predicted nucleic acid-binding protein
MLVDSDVLIWHLRGLSRATQRLDALPRLTISVITYFEILQGIRNRAELIAVQKSLSLRSTEQLFLTPAITVRARDILENLTLSHRLGMGDALIAATALEHGLTLLTANIKHFSAITGLILERFDPAVAPI